MTGQGVERMPRAAHPLPPAPPTSAAAPLPPHTQGAERRRTTLRWGLRVLVVGGLAGAAWLLTGAAAQAADHGGEPSGSLFGPVVDGGATTPVTGLLTAAVQPLEAAPAHLLHHRQDILEVPRQVLTRPAGTATEVVHHTTRTTVDTAAGGVDLVLREVTGPLRLTGGPAPTIQRLTAVADTVTRYALPAAERPQQPAVTPVRATPPGVPVAPPNRVGISKALGAGTLPGQASLGQASLGQASLGQENLGQENLGQASTGSANPGFVNLGPTKYGLTRSGPAKAKSGFPKIAAHRAVAGSATAREGTPGGDGSAPGQLHLGDVSGTPSSSGTGTPTEGGCAAFLPAAIANSTMACQRLPIASGVEVRRLAAEAPTVSPD